MNAMLPFLFLFISAAVAGLAQGTDLSGRRPNIIFILTDDQGYNDMSAHGNTILKTPNLDRLRGEGVRFEDFMVSPTCSPTRSVLLSGRHEFKNGVTHTVNERERMSLQTVTLAQVLKAAGYATGIFGKWHLGDEAEYRPESRGFDEVFIHGGGGIGQSFPGSLGDAPGNKYFDPTILHNGKFEKTQGYCTDIFFERAIGWMDRQQGGENPFFAFVSTNAPHSPYIARPADRARYEGRDLGPATENFFGMIHNIDENVGRLLARLDEWGISRNTLVVFMTDNGGDLTGVKVFNAGMRGSKNTAWIGGTRAISLWYWPGTLRPGPVQALTAHLDFFPTLAELAGARLSDGVKRQVEGRSLVPLLRDPSARWPERHLFTHMGRWLQGTDPGNAKFAMSAVRNSRWALVSEKGGREPEWQLFDLARDYGQQTDVSVQHPEIVRKLSTLYDRWWGECLPLMVNERAIGPRLNSFAELYWKQFGGGPTEADLKRMDPTQPFPRSAARKLVR